VAGQPGGGSPRRRNEAPQKAPHGHGWWCSGEGRDDLPLSLFHRTGRPHSQCAGEGPARTAPCSCFHSKTHGSARSSLSSNSKVSIKFSKNI
jgi:hypothetical protein